MSLIDAGGAGHRDVVDIRDVTIGQVIALMRNHFVVDGLVASAAM